MPHEKREPDKKHEPAALMAFSESSEAFPFPPFRSSQRPTPGMEAAWLEWSRTMRDLDAHMLLLLRVAFLAGFEAGQR